MLLLTPWFWLSAAGFLAVAYMVKCLSSPLRKLPGPAYSIFTSAVLKWHEFHTNRTRYIHRLHQKYGPVVRIGPNEAAFASQTAVKEIYCSGGSGYDKTEFYDLFRVYGRRTMFTTLNKEDVRTKRSVIGRRLKNSAADGGLVQHARRRRILADRYANSNVMRQPSLNGIVHRSKNVLKRCTESVGGSLDLYIALHAYAFDCVTHHLFHPYGVDSLQSEKDEEIMREVAFDDSLQNRLIEFYSPLLHKVIGKVLYLFAKPRETPLADDFVLTASGAESPAAFTLLSRMREKQYDMEQLDMAAESLDHMAAGIDTTGDALCFLMWELSQPSSLHLQRRLQQELTQNPETQFDKLPFLEAVVQEGLRCFPAIPMSLPRYVPRGGRTIDGYFLPEKTVVSCQAYSVHRIDERVFPEPDKFDPDRWLEEEGDAERKRLSFAFANGGRGCIGKHLAMAEMKILLQDIYSRFTTYPDASMTAESMEMSDQLISSRPLGQRCLLRFVPLGEDMGADMGADKARTA